MKTAMFQVIFTNLQKSKVILFFLTEFKFLQLSAETQEFTIGDVGTHDSNNSSYKSLQPQTRYCLTFIIVNKYREKEHRIVYYEKDLYTKPLHKEIHEHNAHVHLYVLAFMLLCVPIGFLVYR